MIELSPQEGAANSLAAHSLQLLGHGEVMTRFSDESALSVPLMVFHLPLSSPPISPPRAASGTGRARAAVSLVSSEPT